MKKEKQDKPVKAEKKQARKTVQERLITELKAITSQLGQKTEDIVIDIEKESKKLAKKITRRFKAILPEHKEEPKAKPMESKSAPSKPETKSTTVKVADKPAPAEIKKSATVKKPKAEATPEKTASVKAASAKTAATKISKAKTTV